MLNREALTKHLKNDENRYLGIRILDKAEYVLKNHTIGYTGFLDPYQISLCTPILNQINQIEYIIHGGVKGAERQIIIIHPEYLSSDDIDSPLQVVKIIGDFDKNYLSHRDFLGSILGLGLKREKIGDIYIENGCAYMITFKEIWEFVRLHLKKISNYSVEVYSTTLDEAISDKRFRIISSTVPSLRLDVIAAVGFEESRSNISKKINNDRVKVNWKPNNNGSYMVHVGDVISFKGLGRIQLLEINGKTKKDRFKISLKRFL